MEYSKQSISLLKAAIKVKVAEQKSLKLQRKTVHFKGERTHSPDQATYQHQSNRWDLRHMYIAYGIMRGKTYEQIEPKAKTEYSERRVATIMDLYQTTAGGEAVRTNP